MARLFDDVHDPLMRDLVGTAAVSEPEAYAGLDEAIVYVMDVEKERDRIRRERMLARKLDLAYERGDLAAIAILEGPMFGYADRFMSEG